ncbi:regulatory protein RecX [Microbacterium sp. ZXX196]|uniref:regulatory protein RecX n=1 Tax=Microbacterium sp. ZXX196 TaxID=2609291 RepID=UPI0018ACE64A
MTRDPESERLAPVVPLFGGAAPAVPPKDEAGDTADADAVAAGWHTTWREEVRASERADLDAGEDAEAIDRAERRLSRSIATRSISEREARDRLRRDGVSGAAVDDIIDRLVRAGAIDDGRVAEEAVHAALTRKNQGRRAVRQALTKRGLAREAIDAALAEMPDDDAERALEFARGKAASLIRYDHDTALRRLVGQLGRRGYGGALALSVANQALEEARRGGGGVRFT